MPEAIDTSTLRTEVGETLIALWYREYLKVDAVWMREEAGCENSLAGKAKELGMRVATHRADTLDDLLIKIVLLRDEFDVDVGPDAFRLISFVAANSLMADLHRLKAAPECFGLKPAALAGDEDEDPILPLYREWWDAAEAFGSHRHSTEDEKGKELCNRVWDSLYALLDVNPASIAGIAALAHAAWHSGGLVFIPGTDDWQAEVNKPCNRAVATIWRFATGFGGYPRYTGEAARS